MIRWETNVDQVLSIEDWSDILNKMLKCSHSMVIKETVVKLHTRWYLTPDRLQFYPEVPVTCFRDCQVSGTLLHTFWSCPQCKHIWTQAATKVAQISGTMVTLTAPMCLLFTPIPDVPPPTQKLVDTLYCAILWAIALNWCSPMVLWAQVLQRMESIKLMERIHHTLLDTLHIYHNKWSGWTSYGDTL